MLTAASGSMAIKTLPDLFYGSVDRFRKPEHLRYKRSGAWRATSSDEFRAAVEETAVVDHYMDLVKTLTGELAQYEKIKKVALLPKELSQEAGELTPTLKVKRRVVEERHRALIDELYQGAA